MTRDSEFPSIEFTAEDAAVIYDLTRSMCGPGDPEAVVLDLRRARYLLPVVAQAFRESGWTRTEVDDLIGRPEIPMLQPGSKFTESD
jgi:hypothetical protein